MASFAITITPFGQVIRDTEGNAVADGSLRLWEQGAVGLMRRSWYATPDGSSPSFADLGLNGNGSLVHEVFVSGAYSVEVVNSDGDVVATWDHTTPLGSSMAWVGRRIAAGAAGSSLDFDAAQEDLPAGQYVRLRASGTTDAWLSGSVAYSGEVGGKQRYLFTLSDVLDSGNAVVPGTAYEVERFLIPATARVPLGSLSVGPDALQSGSIHARHFATGSIAAAVGPGGFSTISFPPDAIDGMAYDIDQTRQSGIWFVRGGWDVPMAQDGWLAVLASPDGSVVQQYYWAANANRSEANFRTGSVNEADSFVWTAWSGITELFRRTTAGAFTIPTSTWSGVANIRVFMTGGAHGTAGADGALVGGSAGYYEPGSYQPVFVPDPGGGMSGGGGQYELQYVRGKYVPGVPATCGFVPRVGGGLEGGVGADTMGFGRRALAGMEGLTFNLPTAGRSDEDVVIGGGGTAGPIGIASGGCNGRAGVVGRSGEIVIFAGEA